MGQRCTEVKKAGRIRSYAGQIMVRRLLEENPTADKNKDGKLYVCNVRRRTRTSRCTMLRTEHSPAIKELSKEVKQKKLATDTANWQEHTMDKKNVPAWLSAMKI